MRQKRSPVVLPLWAAVFPFLTTGVLFLGFLAGFRARHLPKDLAVYKEVRDLVVEDYVEPRTPEDLLYAGLSGMMKSLDRHCTFYPPKEAKKIEEETQGRYEGIGVLLAPSAPPVTILFPLEGSPAERAGLLPGDRILEADGVSLEKLSSQQRVARIKGPAGTKVHLKVLRKGEPPFEVDVLRAPVMTSSVRRASILDAERGIAYLHLLEFQAHTVADVDRAWNRLKFRGARSLILDLRFNGGGSLSQAALLINRFLPEDGKELVQVHGRVPQTSHPYLSHKEEAFMAGVPLVVLVDRSSASASEVFAASIQDLALGVVVGTRTFGKGTVQTLTTLSDPRMKVKFTIARYATPSGLLVEPSQAERKAGAQGGVVPDLPVAMDDRDRLNLYYWLNTWEPPAKYKEQVRKLLEELHVPPPTKPVDPQCRAALELLRKGRPFFSPFREERKG